MVFHFNFGEEGLVGEDVIFLIMISLSNINRLNILDDMIFDTHSIFHYEKNASKKNTSYNYKL